MIKKIFKILVVAIVIVVVVLLILFEVLMIILRKGAGHDLKTRIEIMEEIDEQYYDIPGEIEAALQIYNDWDKLFLSDNFKRKYKNRYFLFPTLLFAEGIYVYKYEDPKKHNIVRIEITHNELLEEIFYGAGSEVYYYEYYLDEKGYIDDLVFLTKNIVFLGTNTRVDDKISATYDVVYDLLLYIADENHNFDTGVTNPYYERFEMPLAKSCKIINKPDIEKLGNPIKSYGKNKNGKYYIVFEYDDKILTWETKYKINKDFEFEYIEYIEAEIKDRLYVCDIKSGAYNEKRVIADDTGKIVLRQYQNDMEVDNIDILKDLITGEPKYLYRDYDDLTEENVVFDEGKKLSEEKQRLLERGIRDEELANGLGGLIYSDSDEWGRKCVSSKRIIKRMYYDLHGNAISETEKLKIKTIGFAKEIYCYDEHALNNLNNELNGKNLKCRIASYSDITKKWGYYFAIDNNKTDIYDINCIFLKSITGKVITNRIKCRDKIYYVIADIQNCQTGYDFEESSYNNNIFYKLCDVNFDIIVDVDFNNKFVNMIPFDGGRSLWVDNWVQNAGYYNETVFLGNTIYTLNGKNQSYQFDFSKSEKVCISKKNTIKNSDDKKENEVVIVNGLHENNNVPAYSLKDNYEYKVLNNFKDKLYIVKITNETFANHQRYNIYNDRWELIFENVYFYETFGGFKIPKEYLTIYDGVSTKVYDKNLKLKIDFYEKVEFDSINSEEYYNNEYNIFDDNKYLLRYCTSFEKKYDNIYRLIGGYVDNDYNIIKEDPYFAGELVKSYENYSLFYNAYKYSIYDNDNNFITSFSKFELEEG